MDDPIAFDSSVQNGPIERVLSALRGAGCDPRPRDDVGRWRPFPTDALPEPVRQFTMRAATAIGVDPSFVAVPLLGVLSSVIGGSRRIQLKPGWTEPAIVWAVIVGNSGTMKTPALDAVLGPLRALQSAALERYDKELAEYETCKVEYEKALIEWRRSDGESMQPQKPVSPIARRLLVSDVTVEAIALILQENPRGVLLHRDELSGLIGSFDRYAKGGPADEAQWLSMFSGQPLIVDRKAGRSLCHVRSARVCISGGIQPAILDRVIGTQHRESGFLARLLLAMPPRMSKRWTDVAVTEADQQEYANVLTQLLSLQPDCDGNPVTIELTPDAKSEWVRFFNEHAAEQAELVGDLAAAWSKKEGYAARFALIIHCVKAVVGDTDPAVIDRQSIAAGVAVARWFANEDRRVYQCFGETTADRERRQLIELIAMRGGTITTRQVMRSGRAFKTSEHAEAALNGLVKEGLARWQYASTGGRQSKQLTLVDASTDDRSPVGSVENEACVNVDGVHGDAGTGDPTSQSMQGDVQFDWGIGFQGEDVPADYRPGPPPREECDAARDARIIPQNFFRADPEERRAIMEVEAEAERDARDREF